jgi:endonuclease/exonuclease/phosphatase family metal-dependent hydrolase
VSHRHTGASVVDAMRAAAGARIAAATLLAAGLLVGPGCGPRPQLELPDDVTDPYVTDVQDGVVWIRPDSPHDTLRLGRWRAAVGPPATRAAGERDAAGLDSLAVVTWNVSVGGGDLEGFLSELRGGSITGRPEPHFVLLLQEALRAGESVPPFDPQAMERAKPIHARPPSGPRLGIDEIAARNDLALLYVPSMRNGEGTPGEGEDRGNAILSTLELAEPVVVELPVERQRRVAISAVIAGATSGGMQWELRVISLHLANRTGLSRFLDTFGRARLRQASFLTLVLDRHDDQRPSVVGADLNTWLHQDDEPVVTHLRGRYPEPAEPPEGGTYDASRWPDPQLDYLMFSLPASWAASYRRLDDTYGSDHYPLLGWIVFGEEESE